MEDILGIVLAIAVVGIAGVGMYVYWERKKKGIADESARRRVERNRRTEDNNPAPRPVARQAGFGRR